MNRTAIALVVLGALITFPALALVLAPGAPAVDVRDVAVSAVDSARRAADPVGIADEVAAVLPPGARAAVGLLVAGGGMVGAHATPDGWWASVAVPTVPPPTLPALALLVGAVLLGAAATASRHHVVATEPTDDEDAVDTVARTVRPGYADGERIVVCPAVVAYVREQGYFTS